MDQPYTTILQNLDESPANMRVVSEGMIVPQQQRINDEMKHLECPGSLGGLLLKCKQQQLCSSHRHCICQCSTAQCFQKCTYSRSLRVSKYDLTCDRCHDAANCSARHNIRHTTGSPLSLLKTEGKQLTLFQAVKGSACQLPCSGLASSQKGSCRISLLDVSPPDSSSAAD